MVLRGGEGRGGESGKGRGEGGTGKARREGLPLADGVEHDACNDADEEVVDDMETLCEVRHTADEDRVREVGGRRHQGRGEGGTEGSQEA